MPELTGVAGTALSHRSQVLNPVVLAGQVLSPPAISTCVGLTSAAAALQRTVASVPPVAAHEGTAFRSQSSNSLKPTGAPGDPPAMRTLPTLGMAVAVWRERAKANEGPAVRAEVAGL